MPAFLESPDGLQHLSIDASKQWEIDFWVRKLSVSDDELRRAIAATGGNAVAVVHLLTAWDGARAS